MDKIYQSAAESLLAISDRKKLIRSVLSKEDEEFN